MVPGFIEAHSHFSQIALLFSHNYLGFYDYPGFEGKMMPGSKTKAIAFQHLQEAEKKLTDPNLPLIGWGYDPIFLEGQEFTAAELDKISTSRPIFVLNASGHIAYVNTYLLNKAGYNAQTNIPGVEKDKNQQPTGALKELSAMLPVFGIISANADTPAQMEKNFQLTSDLARRVGLTTLSDMYYMWSLEDNLTSLYRKSTDSPTFPVRVVLVYGGDYLLKSQGGGEQAVNYLQKAVALNTNKLKFGAVKFLSDGSIQGFTARLNWPGYFNGAPNGIFNTTTAEMKEYALPFWKAGVPIHVHVNGNEAIDSLLDTLGYLQQVAPRKDPLFVFEHNQMANPDQFARIAALGGSTNLFSNQIYYWGDQHKALTMGPDRADRMDDAPEAKRVDLRYSLHSDSPITPLGPLHVLWSAVNRTTASGKTLGKSEGISVEDGLRALTLNAAHLLQLEDEIGSITVGKRADFTVLKEDPLTIDPHKLKDIPIVATIQDGSVYK
jgi:predicted amidohydrolase YtcJ